MEIHHDISSFSAPDNAVLTVGTFDGIHTGHRKVFELLKKTARDLNGSSIVCTFDPPPRRVLDPDNTSLRFLNTIAEKIELIRMTGVDHLIIIPFTREFSRISPEIFISGYLVKKAGAKVIISGYDHMFGRGGQGGYETLKSLGDKFGYKVFRLDPEKTGGEIASSSRIRELLLEAKVTEAAQMLGYNYFLSGNVVMGRQLGRTLGFPTANVAVADPYKLIPARGVYAVLANPGTASGLSLPGMCNIGIRPTFDGHTELIEVNIFGFNQDIYGTDLTIQFVSHIREEKKFAGPEELKQQLEKDRELVLKILG